VWGRGVKNLKKKKTGKRSLLPGTLLKGGKKIKGGGKGDVHFLGWGNAAPAGSQDMTVSKQKVRGTKKKNN